MFTMRNRSVLGFAWHDSKLKKFAKKDSNWTIIWIFDDITANQEYTYIYLPIYAHDYTYIVIVSFLCSDLITEALQNYDDSFQYSMNSLQKLVMSVGRQLRANADIPADREIQVSQPCYIQVSQPCSGTLLRLLTHVRSLSKTGSETFRSVLIYGKEQKSRKKIS